MLFWYHIMRNFEKANLWKFYFSGYLFLKLFQKLHSGFEVFTGTASMDTEMDTFQLDSVVRGHHISKIYRVVC